MMPWFLALLTLPLGTHGDDFRVSVFNGVSWIYQFRKFINRRRIMTHGHPLAHLPHCLDCVAGIRRVVCYKVLSGGICGG